MATLSCVAQHIDNRYSIPTTGMNYERSLGFLERHPYDAAVKANTTAPRHLEYRGIKFTNDTITSHKSHKRSAMNIGSNSIQLGGMTNNHVPVTAIKSSS